MKSKHLVASLFAVLLPLALQACVSSDTEDEEPLDPATQEPDSKADGASVGTNCPDLSGNYVCADDPAVFTYNNFMHLTNVKIVQTGCAIGDQVTVDSTFAGDVPARTTNGAITQIGTPIAMSPHPITDKPVSVRVNEVQFGSYTARPNSSYRYAHLESYKVDPATKILHVFYKTSRVTSGGSWSRGQIGYACVPQ